MIIGGGTLSRGHVSESTTPRKHIVQNSLLRSYGKTLLLLPKYFYGIKLAMQSMSDSLNGGFSFLRNLISLLLAAFLLQSTILAQSPQVPGDATKSIQPSQSVAVVYSATQPEYDGVKLRA